MQTVPNPPTTVDAIHARMLLNDDALTCGLDRVQGQLCMSTGRAESFVDFVLNDPDRRAAMRTLLDHQEVTRAAR